VEELFADDAGAAGDAQDDGDVGVRGDAGAQGAAGEHQGVRIVQEGRDHLVKVFESAGRPHEVAVVHGEHHGVSVLGADDLRQAVLQSPVHTRIASRPRKPMSAYKFLARWCSLGE